MKQSFIFCLLLLLTSSIACASSIELILRPVSPISFGTKDFWNFTVVNNNSQAIDVTFETNVDYISGKQAIKATSNTFKLNVGVSTINNSDVFSSNVNYYSQLLKEADEIANTLLPGKYKYCVTVYSSNHTVLAKECIDVELTMLNPPVLVSLGNEAEIDYLYPIFNWSPPTPVFPNVVYDFKLVEIRDGQTKFDAILRNPIAYGEKGVQVTFLQFPTNAKALEKGKSYAWQVQARTPEVYKENTLNNNSLGISEVFLFKIKDKDNVGDTLRYNELRTKLEGQVVSLAGDKLYFITKGAYTYNKELEYSVFDENNEKVEVKVNRIIESKQSEEKSGSESAYGENKYVLDISNINLRRGYYTLEVRDEKGYSQYLKFKVE